MDGLRPRAIYLGLTGGADGFSSDERELEAGGCLPQRLRMSGATILLPLDEYQMLIDKDKAGNSDVRWTGANLPTACASICPSRSHAPGMPRPCRGHYNTSEFCIRTRASRMACVGDRRIMNWEQINVRARRRGLEDPGPLGRHPGPGHGFDAPGRAGAARRWVWPATCLGASRVTGFAPGVSESGDEQRAVKNFYCRRAPGKMPNCPRWFECALSPVYLLQQP